PASFGGRRSGGGWAGGLVFSRPAQRSLTLRPARSPSRLATLCTRGFNSLVASTAALIATRWSETGPGRAYSRCGPPPFHGAPGWLTYRVLLSAKIFLRASRIRASMLDFSHLRHQSYATGRHQPGNSLCHV